MTVGTSKVLSVSVIIATKYRPPDLEETVTSVFSQTTVPQQLIIVDQSETDENRSRVERLYSGLSEHVRQLIKISYIHDSGIKGLMVARNRGMEVAEGDIWAFLDDDVSLEPTYVAELLSGYQNHPEVAGVSGIISNYVAAPLSRRLWEALFVFGPFYDERQRIYWKAEELRLSLPIPVSKLTGACMSFRAQAIRDLCFDETLPTTMGEDVDFCLRVPGPLVINPRARLFHKRSSPGRSRDHYLRWESWTAHFLYRKYWSRGFRNSVYFAWLNIGLAVMATLGSVRQRSLGPWRALLLGSQQGRTIAAPNSGRMDG